MVLRPVGPLPPGAYWLRRLLVLLVVAGVGLGAWWLFNRDGGDADPAGATTDSTSATGSASPSVSPTQSTTTKAPKKTKSPSATARPCAEQEIEVTVVTDAPIYPAGELPKFTLAVKNVGTSPCSQDVGSSALELRVSSGGSKIWSSDDCNPSGESRIKDLKPGERFLQTVPWDRLESAPGCPTPQEEAPPGDYQVLARDLEQFSEPVPFALQ